MARQRDAAIVGVHRAARGEMRVQRGLDHRARTVPGRRRLDKRRAARGSERAMATYEDILYEARDGIAWITINRPEVLNAFRAKTVDELIAAFRAAWHDPDVGVVVLTGAGDRAFSTRRRPERAQRTTGYGGGGGVRASTCTACTASSARSRSR